MDEKMPDPSTAKSHAEYLELEAKKMEYVKKHGHRMLDSEDEPWEFTPAPPGGEREPKDIITSTRTV